MEKNREVLEIWRKGSERSDAVYYQPGELKVDSRIPLVPELITHSAMAALEGSRLEDAGKMDEAWSWYRAILRSSRLVGRHGSLVQRAFGARMHELAGRRILRWAADPRVDAAMLRRALDDVLAADRLTPPLSDALKLEYMLLMRDLDEMKFLSREIPLPGGEDGLLEHAVSSWRVGNRKDIQQFRFRASNESERSRRAIRLVFANWLAQVDKPAAERAPFAIQAGVLIYEADRAAPKAARAVTPLSLRDAIDQTLLAKYVLGGDKAEQRDFGYGSWEANGAYARERRRRSALIVKLAALLYHREQGKPPAKAGALLDGYLKKLPEGVARDDSIPEKLD